MWKPNKIVRRDVLALNGMKMIAQGQVRPHNQKEAVAGNKEIREARKDKFLVVNGRQMF